VSCFPFSSFASFAFYLFQFFAACQKTTLTACLTFDSLTVCCPTKKKKKKKKNDDEDDGFPHRGVLSLHDRDASFHDVRHRRVPPVSLPDFFSSSAISYTENVSSGVFQRVLGVYL